MATCNDCIHSGVCAMRREPRCFLTNPPISENIEHECLDFHAKDCFVEFPCKVGERLYVLFPKGRAIVEYVVIAFWIEETGTIIRVVDTRFFTTTIFFIKDIGTKAFLTKKEAEQALKEREENA